MTPLPRSYVTTWGASLSQSMFAHFKSDFLPFSLLSQGKWSDEIHIYSYRDVSEENSSERIPSGFRHADIEAKYFIKQNSFGKNICFDSTCTLKPSFLSSKCI